MHYYFTDHIGSVRVVGDGGGDVEQVNHYYPYGGLIGDISTNPETQKYKYNGKEYDTMHGLNTFDYGARQYDGAKIVWDRMDKYCEKYYNINPYLYCTGNPVNAIDPDGKIIIFINGMHSGSGGSYRYWDNFDSQVMAHFKDFNAKYYDGAGGGIKGLGLGKWSVWGDPNMPNSVKKQVSNSIYSNLSAEDRYNNGYNTGANDVENIVSKLGDNEMIRIISHSMDGAYAKGFVQSFVDYISKHTKYSHMLGNIVEYDFAPFQPNHQFAVNGIPTFQYSHRWDLVAGDSPVPGAKQQATSDEWSCGHSIMDFMQYIQSLPAGKYKVVNGQIVQQ